MCWSTYKNKNKGERTAKEDMLVYKIVKKYREFGYVSYYMGMEYILDKEYSINNLKAINCPDGKTIINEGYHSYSAQECNICINHNVIYVYSKNKNKLEEDHYEASIPNSDRTAVVVCVIPKGSIYYKNEHGEIVSDHLIIKNEIEKESLA